MTNEMRVVIMRTTSDYEPLENISQVKKSFKLEARQYIKPMGLTQGEQSRIIPIADDSFIDQFGDLPFRNDGVIEVHASIFPLDRTVNIQSVAEPIISRSVGLELLSGVE